MQLGEPFLEALREQAEVGMPQPMRWERATGVLQWLIAHPLLTSDSSTTGVP
jgi:hypothetical protein